MLMKINTKPIQLYLRRNTYTYTYTHRYIYTLVLSEKKSSWLLAFEPLNMNKLYLYQYYPSNIMIIVQYLIQFSELLIDFDWSLYADV